MADFIAVYKSYDKLSDADLRISLTKHKVGEVFVPIVGDHCSGQDMALLAHLSEASNTWASRHPESVRCTPVRRGNTASAAVTGDAAEVPEYRGSAGDERKASEEPTAQLEQAIDRDSEEVVILAGPSGCGKTSLVWQTLAQTWGIYLSVLERDVGSVFVAAWAKVVHMGIPTWDTVQRFAACVLLGHAIVLNRLTELDPELTSAEWLLWQILDPGGHIKNLTTHFMYKREVALAELKEYTLAVGPKQPLVVVLDEVQEWVREPIEVSQRVLSQYRHVQRFSALTAYVRYLRDFTDSRPRPQHAFVRRVVLAGSTLRMKEALAVIAEPEGSPLATTVYAAALTDQQAVAFATRFGVEPQCAKAGFAALKANVGYRARFWALAVAKYLGMDDPSWCEAVGHTKQVLLRRAGRYSLVDALTSRLEAAPARATHASSAANALDTWEEVGKIIQIATAHYYMQEQSMEVDVPTGELIVSAGLGISTAAGVRCNEPVAAAAVVAVMLETPKRAALLHKAITDGFRTATKVSASCAGFFLELVLASTLSQILREASGERRRMLATLLGLEGDIIRFQDKAASRACMQMPLSLFLETSYVKRQPCSNSVIPEFSAGPDVVNVIQCTKDESVVVFWQCKYGAQFANAVDAVDTVVVGRMGRTRSERLHGASSKKALAVEAAANKFSQRLGIVLAPRKLLNLDWVVKGDVTRLPHSRTAPPHRVIVLDRQLLLTDEYQELFQFPKWLFMHGRPPKCQCKTKCQRSSCGCKKGNRRCTAACTCCGDQCANNAARDAAPAAAPLAT